MSEPTAWTPPRPPRGSPGTKVLRLALLARWAEGARVLALMAVLAGLLAPSLLDAQERPRVLVLATGGTIASRPDAPDLGGNELVAAVPQLADHAHVTVEEFSAIGSSAMTPDHWLRLARRVNEAFAADAGLAGVVITHGTDSMEDTAYFLHLTVKHARPVVLVGAMRSAGAVSADGPANLLAAVRVAVHPDAGGMGGLVVLNDRIHSARDVKKLDNNRVDAFRAPEWGALGVVDADTVVFRRAPLSAHTVETPFDVSEVEALPSVPIVVDYTGADGSLVREAASGPADGLVVQAFGGGRTSPSTTRAVVDVARRGVPVVLTARVPGGRVMERMLPTGDGATPMTEVGVIAGSDLPPHRARVLLMLALTHTGDVAEIQRIFRRY